MNTIRHELWIDADRSKVFEAITTRDGLDAWWGKALNAEAQVGSLVEFDHGLSEPLRMRVTELLPGDSVAWTCLSEFSDPGMPGSEWLGHELRFDVEPGGEGPDSAWLRDRLDLDGVGSFTVLRFSHAGWEDDSRWFAFCNSGWGVTLDGLKRYCERATD
jgi:uncharacterized protein YndB with AHSA1/START domain